MPLDASIAAPVGGLFVSEKTSVSAGISASVAVAVNVSNCNSSTV